MQKNKRMSLIRSLYYVVLIQDQPMLSLTELLLYRFKWPTKSACLTKQHRQTRYVNIKLLKRTIHRRLEAAPPSFDTMKEASRVGAFPGCVAPVFLLFHFTALLIVILCKQIYTEGGYKKFCTTENKYLFPLINPPLSTSAILSSGEEDIQFHFSKSGHLRQTYQLIDLLNQILIIIFSQL